MTKRKPYTSVIAVCSGLFMVASAVAGVMLYLNQFAKADDVQVAMTKAEYTIDKLIENTLAQINRLEEKIRAGRATQDDRRQLDYLRQQLDRDRQMRSK